MILKRHLSGCNIVLARPGKPSRNPDNILPPGRPQGSLYNQQKRLISDCCEAMRLYREKYEPVIFCLTSPGFIDRADEPRFLDKFLKALRKKGLQNYVWVREHTQNGYPHFHFVAEVPFQFKNVDGNYRKILAGRDVVDWSMLWSSYFGSDSPSSIRLGAGHKTGQTKYFLRSSLMSSYLSKYIGKGLGKGDNEKTKPGKRKVSTFGTSCRSGARVKGSFRFIDPEIYEVDLHETVYSHTRKIIRSWHCVESPMGFNNGTVLQEKDLQKLHWKQCGLHPVYLGYPKRAKRIKLLRSCNNNPLKSTLRKPMNLNVTHVPGKFLNKFISSVRSRPS